MVERPHSRTDIREGIVPTDHLIMIGGGIIPQRVRDAPLIFEPVEDSAVITLDSCASTTSQSLVDCQVELTADTVVGAQLSWQLTVTVAASRQLLVTIAELPAAPCHHGQFRAGSSVTIAASGQLSGTNA